MFDEETKDILAELINISFGSATAVIADLFDNFAKLHIPKIDFVDLTQVNNFIMGSYSDSKIYVTTQHFNGEFQGEIVLVMDPQSAKNMQAIVDDDENFDEDEIKQNILEISNILGSSCIGKFAELLVTDVTFAPPSIEYSDCLIHNVKDSPYNKVIVISTVLKFEELNINGKLVFMFSDEMFTWLETALNDFMENI